MEEERKTRKKKKNLRMQKVTGICFLFLLLVFLLANALTRDKEFSDKENRSLAQKPEFSLHTLLDGSFMADYESYQSDQFAGRQLFVACKTKISYMLGERESNGVYKGKQHSLLEEIKTVDEEAMADNLKAIKSFEEAHTDIPMYMMLVPNAANIQKDRLPALAVTADQDAQLADIKKELGDSVKWVDAGSTLKKHKDEDIYYKTDHHWTTLGAYYGFEAYAKAADLSTKSVKKMTSYPVTSQFNGTLASTSGYETNYTEPISIYYAEDDPQVVVFYVEQQTKTSTWYDESKLKEKDKYAMFLGGNYPLIDIRTTADASDVLLVIKDSYANCFLPFLADSYREIVVVDPRYYYGDVNQLISDYSVNQVLFLYNANTFAEDNNISGALEIDE